MKWEGKTTLVLNEYFIIIIVCGRKFSSYFLLAHDRHILFNILNENINMYKVKIG